MKLDLLVPLLLSLPLAASAFAQEERPTGPATAFTGMLFALDGLHAVAGDGEWEIHRLSSDVVTAPAGSVTAEERAAFVPHVRVEVDLTSRAASGSAAETAFRDWEARIGRAFEEADEEAWGYRRLKEVWLDRGMSRVARAKGQSLVTKDADRVPLGTHRSVIELKIPIDRIQGFTVPVSLRNPSDREAGRTPDPTPWLTSVAQRKQVQLGNISVRETPTVPDEPSRWTLTAPRKADLGLDTIRIANFLYLTSTETRSVRIDSVEIRRVRGQEFRLNVGYAEVMEKD